MPPARKRPYWLPLLLVISILLALAILFDWVPFLRGGYGWRWPYTPPDSAALQGLLPGIITLTLYLAGLKLLQRRGTAVYLLWVLLGATAVPVAFLAIAGSPFYILYTRTVSLLTTGAYLKATEFANLSDLLQQWPVQMVAHEAGATHISTSPPGWPALYLLTTKFLEQFPGLTNPAALSLRRLQCDNLPLMSHTNPQIASAWLGLLSPLWGALTVLPLYFLGRELAQARAARKAVAWWPLVPALSMFLGTLNTPYPLLVASTLLPLVVGLYRRRSHTVLAYVSLTLAGVLAAASLMINFVLIPLFLLCGLLILLQWPEDELVRGPINWWDKIQAGIPFAIGSVVALAAYRVAGGHHLHRLLPLAMSQHLDLERPYLPWLWLHTWDVMLFVGLPVFGLFLISLFRLPPGRSRRFALAVGLTLLIMVLSGTARGETGRLWLFFMPLFLLSVGALFSGEQEEWERPVLAAQVAWLLVLIAVIPAVGTGLAQPPQYANIAPLPLTDTPFVPVEATFGDALWLAGYQASYHPQSNNFTLDLSWQVREQLTTNYLFAVLAVDPTGTVQAVKEWLPLEYQYPTTCWQPEAGIVHDQVRIELEENPAAGQWWFSLSAFALDARKSPLYLPVTLPTGEIDDHQIGLGPVQVSP